jgi:oxygen-dependent protoporphyrinogen oxidase
MVETCDVVIIGAGIVGLVTAYELNKQGLKVKLLEESQRVGGVIHSKHIDGYLLEEGPNSFQESDDINTLIKELSLSSELVTADPKMPRYIYFQEKLQAVPLSPPALITSKLISTSGKLRLLAEPFISKKNNLTQEESIADFVRRRLGSQIHDRLVSPFVSGVYAGNTEKLSLNASFPFLAELENKYGSLILGGIKSQKEQNSNKKPEEKRLAKRLCSFANGLATLPKALGEKLTNSLITNCKITNLTIHQETPHYKINILSENSHKEIITNKLVLATPAYIAAKLIENYIPNLAKELKAIEYVSMAIVHLSLNLSDLPNNLYGFGVLIPRSEGIRVLGTIWNTSLFPKRSPKEKILLTNFIGGAYDNEAIKLTDTELSQIVGEELKKILGIKAQPTLVNIHRYQKAIPQYNIGHLSRLSIIESELKKQPNLYLTGNYLQGVSVGDCISRGKKLAINILQIK